MNSVGHRYGMTNSSVHLPRLEGLGPAYRDYESISCFNRDIQKAFVRI